MIAMLTAIEQGAEDTPALCVCEVKFDRIEGRRTWSERLAHFFSSARCIRYLPMEAIGGRQSAMGV